MERPPTPPETPPPALPGIGKSRLWSLPLLALVLWQGWLTLSLFGPTPELAWERLRDDEPILSGRHPLHLYHGHLGARALWSFGRLSCFDPNFQAGYPKTPVFDGDSRPAEMFLFVAGGAYQPAAYKIGLALCWLAVPILFAAAARWASFNRATAFIIALFGMLVWWGTPTRLALEAGNLDLLMAILAALIQISLLLRFDRAPSLWTWLGILVSGYFGWFAHPIFFALLLPLALVYYLSVGARHGFLWHLALLSGVAGAIASNGYWLNDWVSYWWIRAPLHLESGRLLSHRTFHTLWNAPFWGEPADRALALALLALGLVGVWRLNQVHQRAAARLLGLGSLGFLLLALGSTLSEPLNTLGTPELMVPALLFAVPPAVYALLEAYRLATRWTGARWKGVAVLAVPLLAIAGASYRHVVALAHRATATTPLTIGLTPDRAALVEVLRQQTTPAARILWEDRSSSRQAAHWTALLPMLTERAYIGGLDPEAYIEHAYASFLDQTLVGRPLRDWSDVELEDFCRRYNIGWVVCWSPAAVERFRAWKMAAAIATLQDEETGCLFQLDRSRSFALKGRAQWQSADWRRIALADVVPENGQVVLSLHYQAGMQVTPNTVQIEREVDPYDPIPFVRLRVPSAVARITLTWEGP